MFFLDSLLIKGFRNYQHQQLDFNPRLNILVGENGQGKTNLLESIYYLSVTRSFRTNRDQELVKWEEPFFYLKGTFLKDDFKNDVQVSYSYNHPLKVKINNEPVNRYDHLQQFPVVVFSPDDLMLIREGPSIRRRFLNLEASRLNPVYFKELRAYQRVLQQRNHLLKGFYNRKRDQVNQLLEPWDQSLVSLGSNIIHTRLKIIKSLEKEAKLFFLSMTKASEIFTLQYDCSFDYKVDLKDTNETFMQVLESKREQELKKGATVVGPHLDDLKISINGYDTRKYSSQGQKRTAALALKMAEVSLFKMENNECPIILLDDVFSEFDDSRKMHLLEFLKGSTGQCFISSADGMEKLAKKLNRDSKIVTIRQGRVIDEIGRPGN